MAAAAVEPRFLVRACAAGRYRRTSRRSLDASRAELARAEVPNFRSGRREVHPEDAVQPDSPRLAGMRGRIVACERRTVVIGFGRSGVAIPSARFRDANHEAGSTSRKLLLTYTWLSLTLVCFGAAATLLILDQSWRRRMAVSRTLEAFGQAFVREFERPLVADRCGRAAVLARLSVCPRRGAIDVLVAPAADRRYPNLADHRANVEYDIHRVLTTLDDRRFACGPLEARGSWVAIPLRMVSGLQKEGVA